MCVRVFVRHFELNAGKNCKNHLLHCFKGTRPIESGAREFAIPAGWRATETHSLAGKKTDNCHGFRSGAMRYDMMMTAPTRTHEHQRSEKHQRIEFGWRAAKRRRWLVWPVHGRGGNTTERLRWYFISRVATSRGTTVKQCDRFVSLRFDSKLDFEIILKDCIDSLELFMVVQ